MKGSWAKLLKNLILPVAAVFALLLVPFSALGGSYPYSMFGYDCNAYGCTLPFSPSNGAFVSSSQPLTFVWGGASNFENGYFCVGVWKGHNGPMVNEGAYCVPSSQHSYTLPAGKLECGQEYVWRIQTYKTSEYYGREYSFTTQACPQPTPQPTSQPPVQYPQPQYCSSPYGVEGQARCDYNLHQYLVCHNSQWVCQDSGAYNSYCAIPTPQPTPTPTCTQTPSCPTPTPTPTPVPTCSPTPTATPAPSCTAKWLDDYRCSGDWRQRLYQHGDCSTSWENYEYQTYGCQYHFDGYGDCGCNDRDCNNNDCRDCGACDCNIDVSVSNPQDIDSNERVHAVVRIHNNGDAGRYINFWPYVCDADGTDCKAMSCDYHYGNDQQVYLSGHDEVAVDCYVYPDEGGSHKIKVKYDGCMNDRTEYSETFYVNCFDGNCEHYDGCDNCDHADCNDYNGECYDSRDGRCTSTTLSMYFDNNVNVGNNVRISGYVMKCDKSIDTNIKVYFGGNYIGQTSTNDFGYWELYYAPTTTGTFEVKSVAAGLTKTSAMIVLGTVNVPTEKPLELKVFPTSLDVEPCSSNLLVIESNKNVELSFAGVPQDWVKPTSAEMKDNKFYLHVNPTCDSTGSYNLKVLASSDDVVVAQKDVSVYVAQKQPQTGITGFAVANAWPIVIVIIVLVLAAVLFVSYKKGWLKLGKKKKSEDKYLEEIKKSLGLE